MLQKIKENNKKEEEENSDYWYKYNFWPPSLGETHCPTANKAKWKANSDEISWLPRLFPMNTHDKMKYNMTKQEKEEKKKELRLITHHKMRRAINWNKVMGSRKGQELTVS